MKTYKNGQFKPIPIEQRFWLKVNKGDINECWNWSGKKRKDGYGVVFYKGRETRAHRVIFFMQGLALTSSDVVMHKCDNPACVNPTHLKIATQQENLKDMRQKKRNTFSLSGIDHPNSKFNYKDIKEIKKLSEVMSQIKIAKKYNCSQQTISKILTGKRYV